MHSEAISYKYDLLISLVCQVLLQVDKTGSQRSDKLIIISVTNGGKDSMKTYYISKTDWKVLEIKELKSLGCGNKVFC